MELATKALATEDGQSAQTTQLQAISTAIGNIGLNNIGNLATLTTTDKTSLVGAVNEVNAELATKADETEVAAIENVYGSKNLMSQNYVTQTINGVTFTVNANKSVTMNGTATAQTEFTLTTSFDFLLQECTYIFSSGNNNCSSTTFFINIPGIDSSGEMTFTPNMITYPVARIMIRNGVTVNNQTIYPMIRDARITDATYVPYAMTNKELTDSYSGIINNGVPMLRTISTLGFAESPIDIDNYNVGAFYGFRVRIDGAGFSGTAPTGIGGNTIFLMGFSSNSFGVQIAMGFGSSTIAVRNKPYNASGSTWNPWTYLSKTNFINAPERFSMKDQNYETVITFSGTSSFTRTPHYQLILAGQTGVLAPIDVILRGTGASGASIVGVAVSDNGGGNVTVSNNSIIINNIVGGGWGCGILMNLIPYDNPTYTVTNRAKS